ncbi:CDP-diacylglycerol--glycerol-3-phosphate 3-phosphatidyltransferase [Ureaplasma canigenitalium]|uniref:CDP-diacylglycerol--glycerol-3-phosphate 3-phosphatidyltransferase n=1 Tax=Ureaplasma canigenitalium TaxID=42092 RepID=UPI0006914F1B|nr:CDP-diacylglycerol--glycerol-3-phosphate 3-phosphatidyltransferase [Ureaplasma canigenitalium]
MEVNKTTGAYAERRSTGSGFKMTKDRLVKVPNGLSITRIVLALVIIIFLLIDHYLSVGYGYFYQISFFTTKSLFPVVVHLVYTVSALRITSFILFLIAAITDFLDGYIARKYKVITTFGKIIDPIADKFLNNGVLIVLAIDHSAISYLVIINILRDVYMSSLRIYQASRQVDVSANIIGKIRTVLMFISIFIILIANPFGFTHPNLLNNPSAVPVYINQIDLYFIHVISLPLYITTIFAITSAVIYTVQFQRKITTKKSS